MLRTVELTMLVMHGGGIAELPHDVVAESFDDAFLTLEANGYIAGTHPQSKSQVVFYKHGIIGLYEREKKNPIVKPAGIIIPGPGRSN